MAGTALWLCAAFVASASQGVIAETAARPNIILLVLDDQDSRSPFWEAMPQTAALLRDAGVTFTRAIAPTPICTPGRATLLSGRLAHNTGVYTIDGPYGGQNFRRLLDSTFVVQLQKSGYTNAMFGKLRGETAPEPGWDYWCAIGGPHLYEGYNYTVTEQDGGLPSGQHLSAQYSTDFLADKVTHYLQNQASNQAPFFIWLGPTAPHLPLPPARRHMAASARWRGRMPTTANYKEPDLSSKSRWLQDTGQVRLAAVPYANGEYPKRMGSLMAVDEMVGRIKTVLDQQGRWQNTVLILTSDNGYNLGAHRLIHKMAPYEESIQIPLVAAGPGIVNDTVDRLVGLHDIGPTILNLAGAEIPSEMDGKSLLPYLKNGAAANLPNWRTSIVTEYQTGGVHPGYAPMGPMHAGFLLDIPTYRSLRTDRMKYILWLETGEEEVYDLVEDPLELSNLLKTAPALGLRFRDTLSARLQAEMNLSGQQNP
jgi:arylsulfatase A-like enzyme